MKRFALLCGLIAALLCITQNAHAQYTRQGADIVDRNGNVLSDTELIKLVGNDVFAQTVVGARKQYKAGNGLIWGGVAGVGLGLTGAVLTGIQVGKKNYSDVETALKNDSSIAAMYMGSTAVMSVGASALSAGIVLKTIGKKRLNWVEGQANAAKGYSLNLGATPNGVGIAVRF
jgi:Na+-transporting NADH:ubiquinone oxidoreductase subunit NqrE